MGEECAIRVPRPHLDNQRRHLDYLLRIYTDHYNCHRPYRALENRSPVEGHAEVGRVNPSNVRRRDRLGGLLPQYDADAA